MTAPAPSPAEQAVIERFGIFAEERVIEEVARAIYVSTTQESDAEIMALAPAWDENTDYIHRLYRRLAAAAVAAYRAQDGGAEGAVRRVEAVVGELDAARASSSEVTARLAYREAADALRAALAPQAGEQPSGFRKRPVDLTPAGPGQEVCGERFGRYGVCDLPKGHPPIAEAMGWLHSQDAR